MLLFIRRLIQSEVQLIQIDWGAGGHIGNWTQNLEVKVPSQCHYTVLLVNVFVTQIYTELWHFINTK